MAQGKTLPSDVGIQNTKFDTALLLNRLRQYQLCYPHIKTKCQKRLEGLGIQSSKIKSAEVGVKIIGKIFNAILNRNEFKHNGDLFEYIKAARESLTIQEEHLLQNAPPSYNSEFFKNVEEKDKKLFNPPRRILQFFDSAIEFDKLLVKHRRISHMGNKYITENKEKYESISINHEFLQDFSVYLTRDEIFIISNDHCYYLPFDQLLMIQNKIHETLNVLLIGWLLSGACWSDDFYSTQEKLISFMTQKVCQLGNSAYTLFKNFDGLSTGYILSREQIFRNDEPITNVLKECLQNKVLSSREIATIKSVFDRLPQESLELSSMNKLLGHPDIQTLEGIDKLRKRTFQDNPVDHQEISDLLSSAKKNFIHQFLIKRKRWPTLLFTAQTNPALRYCCLHNIWIHDTSIPSHFDKITLRDFSEIELDQVEEFDNILSQFDYLKDTALAETRSVLNNPTVYNIKDNRLRRTLVYFLISKSPHVGVVDYMKKYKNDDPLCLEYCVIKLTQKERELKLEGRLFGQSPYEERARRCILEANISRFMEKYNKNQAMTLSELQKFQKLYVLSRLSKKYTDYYVIVISVDVEAWNNNFRKLVCEPYGREIIDKLFGSEHYEKIMDIFQNSVFIISDGVFDYRWDGQLGGIEGLAQKFWTLIYESVASRVADITGYLNFLMVNGDDLRVILAIPKQEVEQDELKELISGIANSFETNFNKYGFKLKIQETYFSTSLLGFGKIYLFDGTFCTLTLKKGSKLHGLANLMGDYPLEYIKGVFSECVSTMAYSVNHRYLYLIALLRFFMYLDKFNPEFKSLSLMDKVICTLLPRNFGGFPILPYIRGLYKGDSDLETIWWSIYFFVYQGNKIMGQKLFLLATSFLKQTNDFSGLAMNPYSLPNKTPPEGFSCIQSFIQNRLPSITQNKKFKELLVQSSGKKKKLFLKSLYSCNPIPAKPLSIIYETSACGIVDEFVSRFDSSKSIGALISKKFTSLSSIRVLQRAKIKDLEKIGFLIGKIKNPSDLCSNYLYKRFPSHIQCPTKYSDVVRTWCYKKEIIGITYPCIADQVKICSCSEVINQSSLSAITFWKEAIPSTVNPNYSHGSNKMNIGNHTHLKLLAPDIDIENTSPGLRRLKKLLKIYSMMTSLGPECEEYMNKNLEDLTGIDIKILKNAVYHYTSGSITHRVPTNHWSPLVGPNELSNVSTFVKSTTRTDSTLKTKGGDYTINFALIRAHINKLAMYSYEFHGLNYPTLSSTGWAVISDCPTCTYEVSDKPIHWQKRPPLISFNLINNEYATLNKEDINILKTKLINFESNKHQRVYQRLDKENEAHVLLARQLTARNFLTAGSEDLKGHLVRNQLDGTIQEEDLSILYAVTGMELANLTDLKCTPCSILWDAIIDFMTDWYFSTYPEEFGGGTLESIVNIRPSGLPLDKFCESLIESGYWPVFYNYIKTITSIDPPSQQCTDPIQLKLYLNRAVIRELMEPTQSIVSRMTTTYIVPVTNFPNNEDIMKFAEFGIKQTFFKIIKNWFLTVTGSTFWREVKNNNLDATIPILNILCCLKTNLTYSNLDVEEFQIFIFNEAKDDSFLMRTILRLSGINQTRINQMWNYLKEFELTPIEDETLKSFTSIQLKIELLPVHESISVVREVGNSEFKEFYKLKQQYENKQPISQDYVDVEIKVMTRNKNELIISREDSKIHESLFNNRIKSLQKIISKNLKNQIVLDQFTILKNLGKHGYKAAALSEILDQEVPIEKTSPGTCLVINDKSGSYSAAVLSHYRRVKCINLSVNYINPDVIPTFSNLDYFLLSSHERIDVSLSRLSIGDFTNMDYRNAHLEWIKNTYNGQLSHIIVNYSKNLQEKFSFILLCESLIIEYEQFLEKYGVLIIRIGSRIPSDLLQGLRSLSLRFNSIKFLNSVISTSSFIDLFIVCCVRHKPPFSDIIITGNCVKQIGVVLRYYSNPVPRSMLWDEESDYKKLQLLFKKYGRSGRTYYEKIFQSITFRLLPYDLIPEFQSWLVAVKNGLNLEINNLIRILRLQAPTGTVDVQVKYITSAQHTLRLIVETQILLVYVSLLSEAADVANGISMLFDYGIPSLDTVISVFPPDLMESFPLAAIMKILGSDWISSEYEYYSLNCLSFMYWNVVKFI